MNPLVRTAALILSGFLISSPSFSQTGPPVPDFLRDLNQDGTIDFKDLLILIESWGLEGIETPTPSPTETPADQNSFDVELPFPTPIPMKMVRIPAGSFMMGSPDTERSRYVDEGPQHQVTIANDFFMGQTEVTQAQWKTVMGSLPECDVEGDFGRGDNHPVYCVSWIDCQDFLAALNNLSQEGAFRLPTEAEWEYACRAGTTKRFYFGNSLGCSDEEECEDCEAEPTSREKLFSSEATVFPPEFKPQIIAPIELKRSDFMWFCANSGILSQPVRSLRGNAFGLFDMAGNLYEWVQDEYHFDYVGAPTDGSAWIGGGSGRSLRGGAFASIARFCRSASRFGADPSFVSVNVGFRIVWTP